MHRLHSTPEEVRVFENSWSSLYFVPVGSDYCWISSQKQLPENFLSPLSRQQRGRGSGRPAVSRCIKCGFEARGKWANFPERLLMKTPSMLCPTILYKEPEQPLYFAPSIIRQWFNVIQGGNCGERQLCLFFVWFLHINLGCPHTFSDQPLNFLQFETFSASQGQHKLCHPGPRRVPTSF